MSLFHVIRQFLGRRRLEREMAEELQSHLEARIAEHTAAGMSPEQARAVALRQFG